MQLMQFAMFFCHALYGALYATHNRLRIIVVLCLWQALIFAKPLASSSGKILSINILCDPTL